MKTRNTLLGIIVILLLLGLGYLFFFRTITPTQTGFHYAANSTKDFYDQAYANVKPGKPNDQIFGITVNHHLLAPNLIAQEISLIATDRPITVVLLSPNHFMRGEGGVISSLDAWVTPYGNLDIDKAFVTELTASGQVNVDETPFDQEHGINNIVGFIKRSLPNAKFVPLIIKENLSDDKADALAAELKQSLPADAIVVGSLDFSHYLTSNAAEFHDTQTLSVIHDFDYGRIPNLDIDSHPGLRLLLKYFELQNAQKFVLTSHENSSTVTGNENFVETTSYINGYFTSGHNDYDSNRTTLYFNGLNDKLTSGDALNPLSTNYAFAKSERLFQYNDLTVTGFRSDDIQVQNLLKKLGFNLQADPNKLSPEIDFTASNPRAWQFIAFKNEPIALGFVMNPKLTDIYIFPLAITDKTVTLLAKDKAVTLLTQMVAESQVTGDVAKQILQGHIIIK